MFGEHADILGFSFVLTPFADVASVKLPCVYLIAHGEPGRPGVHRIHYAGQTRNLAKRFAKHHQMEAALAAGATHVLALWVEQQNDRLNLEALLRYHYRPPLNAEEVPSHAQGWGAAMACGRPDIAERARAAQMSAARFVLQAGSLEPPLSKAG